MAWRERILDTVPASAAMAASLVVLVAGWAALAPDDESPPLGFTAVAVVLLAPAIGRAAFLPWWRGVLFVAAIVMANLVTSIIAPLWLWLAVALVITVPVTWALLDEPWRSRR